MVHWEETTTCSTLHYCGPLAGGISVRHLLYINPLSTVNWTTITNNDSESKFQFGHFIMVTTRVPVLNKSESIFSVKEIYTFTFTRVTVTKIPKYIINCIFILGTKSRSLLLPCISWPQSQVGRSSSTGSRKTNRLLYTNENCCI